MNINEQQNTTTESKLQTREEQLNTLHSTIWSIADDLRGKVDGWDFKIYVLGILFYRYISENFIQYANKHPLLRKETNLDYLKMEDEVAEVIRKTALDEKGFFILPSQLFQNVAEKAVNNNDLIQTIETIFKDIEEATAKHESNKAFKGLFVDLNVNSPKLGNTQKDKKDKLTELLNKIYGLQLGNFKDNSIDVFGSAYEYLMQMYATYAGKSGGEFYTPQEVAELLVRLATVGKQTVNKVYDPACGSGGLLLKCAKIIGKNNVKKGFFGQDVNLTTYNLCRFNMLLHDLNYKEFNIAIGDTLTTPDNEHIKEKPFDVIVSNPPYSIHWIGEDDPNLIKDERYAKVGILPPKSKADLAFILHGIAWLSEKGIATYVVFPGVLYRTAAEYKIRKYLIDNNFIDCIISLPEDMFFGATIATCIIVLKRNKIDKSTLFINATQQFGRKGNKNVLQKQNIQNILKAYTERQTIDGFANIVEYERILKNEYNLSPSLYVNDNNLTQKIDIDKLNREINKVVVKQKNIRKHIDKIINNL